ncbi:protein AUXIN-REGULATED GENE INVOLVED IN ORGAN SIZE-like [Phragmites australis]|uniref:protein AUXIN-REGULATED GENE INVOLVED IN ORGAN SIZE-like n=1 Tax=Phragmites australis TaxID=29695 RepID=UPI002D771895|nr:protein AUXIN-REGULATED GENE INVOLVED IN ORGAN SIZE-like [Phragmites australis]
MLVELLMAMETDQLVGDQRPRRQSRRHAVIVCRQNATKGQHQNAPSPTPPTSGLSTEAFLVMVCVAVSLIVLPLVLPPLPPPPSMLLLVPVCLLLLLAALATFVPSDMRSMASSYL